MIHPAIAKYLDANVPSLTYNEHAANGNVFVGFLPDTPNLAVSVVPTGGLPQFTLLPVDLPTVQLLVRGGPHDVRQAYDLARACYDVLNGLDLVELDPGGDDEVFLSACTAQQSDPISLGKDDNFRFRFSINLQLRLYTPTAHRA